MIRVSSDVVDDSWQVQASLADVKSLTVQRYLYTSRQVSWTFRAPSARPDLLPCTYRLPSAWLGLLPWPRKTLAACKSRDLHVQGCAPTDSLGPIRLKCDFRPQFIKRRCSSGGCKDRASASTALNGGGEVNLPPSLSYYGF